MSNPYDASRGGAVAMRDYRDATIKKLQADVKRLRAEVEALRDQLDDVEEQEANRYRALEEVQNMNSYNRRGRDVHALILRLWPPRRTGDAP